MTDVPFAVCWLNAGLDLVPLLTINTINAPPLFNASIGDGVVDEISCYEQTLIGRRFKPGFPHFCEGGSAVVRVLGRLQGLRTVDQSICRLLATFRSHEY